MCPRVLHLAAAVLPREVEGGADAVTNMDTRAEVVKALTMREKGKRHPTHRD